MNQPGNMLIAIVTSLLLLHTNHILAKTKPAVDKNEATIIPSYEMKVYDQDIAKIYASNRDSHSNDKATRIAAVSAAFVGKPYLLGALGEGPQGKFDQSPLYRTDAFDCVTLVSTVVALANADNLQQFKQLIPHIRYQQGEISYANRNHFMSVDWNKNNSYQGLVQDITYKIVDHNGKPIASIANTVINKPAWYNQLTLQNIKSLKKLSPAQSQRLLQQLHEQGKPLQQEKSVLLYLPLSKLFDAQGKPKQYIFDQIPNGSIIEIVRPNWAIEKIIGTRMNVSHLGLAIRNQQGLIYREASLLKHKVIDIPLTDYLKNYLSSKTVKGINVQLIV